MLPAIHTDDALDAFMDDPVRVRAALDHVASALGTGPLTPPVRGSALVGLGTHTVAKLMAPMDATLAATEAAALRALHGQLPVATPELLDHGTLDGWTYTVMRRLPGQELADVWDQLTPADLLGLAAQLGRLLAALHQVPAPSAIPQTNWQDWLDTHVPALVDTQRRRGCPESLLEGLDELVAAADLSEGRRCWLHTEVMPEHLLVQHDGESWRLSGLFDFEPSMVGPQDYELAAVGVFFSRGRPAVFRAVQEAMGVSVAPERVFAMAALHRYSRLGWYHQRLGGPAHDVAALPERWFGRTVV